MPNVLLTTHEGKQVRFYDDLVKDKLVTLNFMYTSCPATCPLTTANLARVQELLGERVGRDIFMYSITLDPKRDTPEVLRKYAKDNEVRPGWQFLTGTPEEIERLRQHLGFTVPNPQQDKDPDTHVGLLRYGNEPLQLWGGMAALAKPTFLAEAILWVDWPEQRMKHALEAQRRAREGGAAAPDDGRQHRVVAPADSVPHSHTEPKHAE